MSWAVYKNGNAITKINLTDGTKIRETEDDEFNLEFPESLDINCTSVCDAGCRFCYANCSPAGKHAAIMDAKFIDTLRPYTEAALQVNDLSHPDLIPFLKRLKEKRIIASITVNQIHFERKEAMIKKLADAGLINGIGISLRNPTPEFISRVQKYPNAVIHAINGILSRADIEVLRGKGLKLLILGYKNLGRGVDYKRNNSVLIKERQNYLSSALPRLLSSNDFKLVSFDNLALDQLKVKRYLTPEQWDELYMGDEGTSSMYIDLVKGKFGVSSLCPEEQMHPLKNDIKEMFMQVKEDIL